MATISPSNYPNAPSSRPVSVLMTVALVLLIIGGLNWALVGLFDLDLVAAVLGVGTLLSRAVYVIVGLAALVAIFQLPRATRAA